MTRASVFLVPLLLGTLGAPSVARATGAKTPAEFARALEASRAAMKAYVAKGHLDPARGIGMHPTLALLGEYHALHAKPSYPNPTELIARDANHEIVIDSLGQLSQRSLTQQHSTATEIDGTVLRRLGIHTAPQMQKTLAPYLLRAAGLEGDPDSPELQARAAQLVAQKNAHAKDLLAVLRGSQPHDDLALYFDVHQARWAAGEVQARSPDLITRGSTKLSLWREVSGAISLVRTVNGLGSRAQVADLHDFGIHTRADLDLAVQRAIVEIAPEDLE